MRPARLRLDVAPMGARAARSTTPQESTVNHRLRILCPVDFGDAARNAFEHAVALAGQGDSDLILLHAAPPAVSSPQGVAGPMARLAELARRAEASGVRVTMTVENGHPVDVILAVAQSSRVDLIVLGTNGRGVRARWPMRAIAERIVQDAPCRTLVVPWSATRRVAGTASPARVLCAVSFSPSSMTALAHAIELTQEHASQLVALHVLEELSAEGRRLASPTLVPESRHLRTKDAWRRLQAAMATFAGTAAPRRSRVTAGIPSQEIVRVAREMEAHLIVMGSSERHPVRHAVAGSTTARVIRAVSCPVLVVPCGSGVRHGNDDVPVRRVEAVA